MSWPHLEPPPGYFLRDAFIISDNTVGGGTQDIVQLPAGKAGILLDVYLSVAMLGVNSNISVKITDAANAVQFTPAGSAGGNNGAGGNMGAGQRALPIGLPIPANGKLRLTKVDASSVFCAVQYLEKA